MNATKTDRVIAEEILRIMREKGMTLATAESCTSGRIIASLTSVDGASEYVRGGLAAYQNDVKIKLLGVPESVIRDLGVVSEPVVRQMVRGACELLSSDYAIASTGYTGTGGDGKASGTIWIGWGCVDDIHSVCLHDNRGREANTAAAAERAISEFLEYLKTKYETR